MANRAKATLALQTNAEGRLIGAHDPSGRSSTVAYRLSRSESTLTST